MQICKCIHNKMYVSLVLTDLISLPDAASLSLWNWRTCLRITICDLNILRQMLQAISLFVWCDVLCWWRALSWLNRRPHTVQGYGFIPVKNKQQWQNMTCKEQELQNVHDANNSPECILVCRIKLDTWLNFFPQVSQIHLLIPKWIFKCVFRSDRLKKAYQ